MFSCSLPTLFAAGLTVAGLIHAQKAPAAINISNFVEESVITEDQLTSQDAPALPDDLVAAIQSGSVELHQRLVIDSVQSTLSVKLIVLPSGSPLPTPDSVSSDLV